jgi:hypothetical protein
VPDVDHAGQHPARVQLQQAPGEGLDPGLVQRPGLVGPEVVGGQRAFRHVVPSRSERLVAVP